MASTVVEGDGRPDKVPKGTGLPPESTSSAWTRRMVILAFWVVAVCLGLPHWTWTTSIHRSELPLDEMRAWVEGRACLPAYPLHMKLQSANMDAATKASFAEAVTGFLSERRDVPAFYTYRVISDEESFGVNSTSETVLTINMEESPAGTFPEATLSPWSSTLNVKYSPPITAQIVELVEHAVFEAFEDESAALSYLMQNTPYAQYMHFPSLTDEKRAALDARTTRAFKYASTYHLTFSLFTPAGAPSAWAINEAIEEYITPLLAPLSSISKFTIDTQVQLYASFAPSISGPTFDASDKTWRLSHGDLTGFINAAEWPLSPSIASGPTINFVLYVPAPDKSPLLIEHSGGTNWLIPQWGGVQIHNPGNSSTGSSTGSSIDNHTTSPAAPALTLDDLRGDMLIFADQLAALLSVPSTPAALAFRLSSLKRERATSLMLSASATLGALARLTFKLTSIAIPDAVSRAVHETVRRLDAACSDLGAGSYQSALEHARVAEAQAERAFFEPSMVGQVYFPDEHKVAVYVPLLGPMAVPLLMAAVKELRALVRRRKAKAG